MFRLLTFALLLALAPLPETESDVIQLHGTWRVISWTDSGIARSPASIERIHAVYFTGNLYRWEGDPLPGRFLLDATTRPKSVDYIDPNGVLWLGIYEIEGDHFRDCFRPAKAGSRPHWFGSRPGDGVSCVEKVRLEGPDST